MVKVISDLEIKVKSKNSYVCFETGWTDFISNERSLRNSIELRRVAMVTVAKLEFASKRG